MVFEGPDVDHNQIAALSARREASGRTYLEFLREEAVSLGLYVLRAGAEDPQQPHTEDEAYYIIEGAAQFQCGGENCEVGPGSVLFVKAGVEHRFHAISEDLTILVFFAPPEGTLST